MKKLGILIILTVLSFVLLSSASCRPENSDKIKVVTSTSLLDYIVQQVGGEHVEIANLVPPAQHPGNYDIKPGDVQNLATADLFLLHGWPGEGYAEKMISSANNPNLNVIKIVVEGNWMTPPVQRTATDKVADALSQVDSSHAQDYRAAAEAYKSRVDAKEADIRARLAPADVTQVKVIAAGHQVPFLKWCGMNIVATYGLPDSLTPQAVQELVEKGKAVGATLVVDNLHSGQNAGKAVAEDLNATRIILINFPGGFSDTETWEKAIDKNIDIILEAVGS